MSIIDEMWTNPSTSGEAWPTGFTIDENAYPRAGAASYAQPYLQSALESFSGAPTGLNQAISNLASAPDYIEKARQSMIQQYWDDVPSMFQENAGNLISDLARRGVLSSTVASSGLTNIGKQITEGATQAETEANTWAATEGYKNLLDTVEATLSQNTILNQLFGQTQESTNELAPIQLALQTVLGLSA